MTIKSANALRKQYSPAKPVAQTGYCGGGGIGGGGCANDVPLPPRPRQRKRHRYAGAHCERNATA